MLLGVVPPGGALVQMLVERVLDGRLGQVAHVALVAVDHVGGGLRGLVGRVRPGAAVHVDARHADLDAVDRVPVMGARHAEDQLVVAEPPDFPAERPHHVTGPGPVDRVRGACDQHAAGQRRGGRDEGDPGPGDAAEDPAAVVPVPAKTHECSPCSSNPARDLRTGLTRALCAKRGGRPSSCRITR